MDKKLTSREGGLGISTLKGKYKKLSLTKIWGQFDSKTCLNLTKISVREADSLAYLQKASVYEALVVKLTPDFRLRIKLWEDFEKRVVR